MVYLGLKDNFAHQQWQNDRNIAWDTFLTCTCVDVSMKCAHMLAVYLTTALTIWHQVWQLQAPSILNDNGNGNCNAVCSLGGNGNGNAICR